MPFSQPFDDTFRRDVEVIIQDSTRSDDALHNDAERYLQILEHPSLRDINRPAWVHRIQWFSFLSITYTSNKFFDALYETADTLMLVAGKRYVSATICASGSRAESVAASLEVPSRCVAEALSQLASAWIAYMLWPFFVDGMKSASEVHARPRYPPRSSESAASQSRTDRRLVVKQELLQRSAYVCFMSGYVHLYAPPEFFDSQERVTAANLQVIHIFRPPCAMRDRGMRDDDKAITSDIMNQYCDGPMYVDSDGVQVGTKPGVPIVTEARNSLVMESNSCAAFHSFRWCLHPSRNIQVANQYHVEVYEPNRLGAQYVASPSPITFEDQSHKFSSGSASSSDIQPSVAPLSPGSDRHNSPPSRTPGLQHDVNVDVPGVELLRVHAALAGALHLSGAMKAFELIWCVCKTMDEACLPGASGSTFLQSVVAYEGREVCAEAEMRGIRARAVRVTADDWDSDSDSDRILTY